MGKRAQYIAIGTRRETDLTRRFGTVHAIDTTTSQGLAIRHARAMKAVLLAARAWAKAWKRLDKPEGLRVADRRLVAAQDRLAKIEKEVSRG